MNKLRIRGKALKPDKDLVNPIQKDYLSLSQIIEVSTLRAGNEPVDINIKNKDDIINIEFEDGAEWIASGYDFTEIFGEKILNKRSDSGTIELPGSLSGGDDRGLKEIGIKLISLFKSNDKLADIVAENIGIDFDNRIMPEPGLFKLGKDLQGQAFQPTNRQDQHFLLLIHGTASSTEGSFGELRTENSGKTWNTIKTQYHDIVLALEHRTVSVSPIQNAIDALNALPAHCSLDIVSHSRGGIVADILARCDKRNDQPGFTQQELAKMNKEDKHSQALMEEINALIKVKAITVNKVVRVACPAQGTTLLSERLDHFLNGLLRAIGLAFGGKINPFYQLVRAFIVDVIKAKATPNVMPGLNAMIPNSPFQQVINNPHVLVKSHLAVIEGNSEFGGNIKQSILVIFSNLFYRAANDFVVNTSSMRYGARREHGYHLFLSQDNQTSHFNYFKNKNSKDALIDALKTPIEKSINGYTFNPPQSDNRGVALGIINMGEVNYDQVSGSRPIVIYLLRSRIPHF